jgi:hypothetical protein
MKSNKMPTTPKFFRKRRDYDAMTPRLKFAGFSSAGFKGVKNLKGRLGKGNLGVWGDVWECG